MRLLVAVTARRFHTASVVDRRHRRCSAGGDDAALRTGTRLMISDKVMLLPINRVLVEANYSSDLPMSGETYA